MPLPGNITTSPFIPAIVGPAPDVVLFVFAVHAIPSGEVRIVVVAVVDTNCPYANVM